MCVRFVVCVFGMLVVCCVNACVCCFVCLSVFNV